MILKVQIFTFQIDIMKISYEIALRRMPQNPFWWKVNIGSSTGLVPSGNKPLPEPLLAQINVAIWRH